MSGQQLAKVGGASTLDWLYRIFAYWVGRLVDGKTIFRASKLFPQVSWLRHPLIPNAVPDLLTVSIYTPSALLSFCKARETF